MSKTCKWIEVGSDIDVESFMPLLCGEPVKVFYRSSPLYLSGEKIPGLAGTSREYHTFYMHVGELLVRLGANLVDDGIGFIYLNQDSGCEQVVEDCSPIGDAFVPCAIDSIDIDEDDNVLLSLNNGIDMLVDFGPSCNNLLFYDNDNLVATF